MRAFALSKNAEPSPHGSPNAHGGRHNGCIVFHILGNDALIRVEVGVVSHGHVLDRILLQSNPGQARVVKGCAIGTAYRAAGGGNGAGPPPQSSN